MNNSYNCTFTVNGVDFSATIDHSPMFIGPIVQVFHAVDNSLVGTLTYDHNCESLSYILADGMEGNADYFNHLESTKSAAEWLAAISF